MKNFSGKAELFRCDASFRRISAISGPI